MEWVCQLFGVHVGELKGGSQLLSVPPGGLVADSCLGIEGEVDMLE